jgi:hypothetical protein
VAEIAAAPPRIAPDTPDIRPAAPSTCSVTTRNDGTED